MDVDALLERLLGDLFVPLILGAAAVFVYFLVLARAFQVQRLRVALAEVLRRRIAEQEALQERLGYAPRLDRYRRLEAALRR